MLSLHRSCISRSSAVLQRESSAKMDTMLPPQPDSRGTSRGSVVALSKDAMDLTVVVVELHEWCSDG